MRRSDNGRAGRAFGFLARGRQIRPEIHRQQPFFAAASAPHRSRNAPSRSSFRTAGNCQTVRASLMNSSATSGKASAASVR